MNKAILHLLLFSLSIALFDCSLKQKKVNYDIVYVYQPNKTLAQSRYLDKKDSIEIFISLYNPILYSKVKEGEYFHNFSLYYKISTNGFASAPFLKDSLNSLNTRVIKSEEIVYLSFRLLKTPDLLLRPFLILYQTDLKKNKTEVLSLPISINDTSEEFKFILYNKNEDHPIIENYITTTDTALIISGEGTRKELFASLFLKKLSSSTPPHKNFSDDETISMDRDSLFKLEIQNKVNFSEEGLYFIQKDTSDQTGFSFLAKHKPYPQINSVREMIDPLAYITNTSDFNKIKNSANLKIALDSFWLSIGGSKDYSRALIKAYYEKVEYSNKVFTSYKEGWKTDRGMIYIVFGKPDQVYRDKNSEEWIYENIMTHIVSFTFEYKKNKFSSDYKLIRNPKYEKYWFSGIEKWRNGIIIK